MLAYREEYLTRMICLYGDEHPVVVQYAHLLETFEESEWNRTVLRLLLEAHEKTPLRIMEDEK